MFRALNLWLCFTLLVISCPPLFAQKLPVHDLDALAGEHHTYALDFLFFSNLAEGEIKLEPMDEPGFYRAELVGRTLGVAAWLTGDRTQRYTSTMEETADGHLRSLIHETQIIKRKSGEWKNRSKRYRFDYLQGKVFQEKGRNNIYHPGKVFDLPLDSAAPVDLLTAFYNLRAGVYGKVEAGKRIFIPTLSSKGISKIEIAVLTADERDQLSSYPDHGILLRVILDPEVFETGGGAIYLWFDDDGLLMRGVVEDVIGMGDVIGQRREEEQP
jgi:hypothetical protein